MQKTVVQDIWMWKRWQPDRSMDFNSFFIKSEDGNIVVDPLEPDADDLAQIEEMGGVAWVIVTNRDHERATKAFVDRFEAKLAVSDADADELALKAAQRLREETFHGWRVIGLEGFKTAGEVALYSQGRRALILGDALWGDPAGALRLGAEAKLTDRDRALASIRKLLDLRDLDYVLVGDGAPIFGGARKAIEACVEAKTVA